MVFRVGFRLWLYCVSECDNIGAMKSPIPSGDDLKRLLSPLTNTQLYALEHHSSVPFTTLWKIRAGVTVSPGIETVRRFYPFLVPVVNIPPMPEPGRASTAPVIASAPAALATVAGATHTAQGA